MKIEGVNPAAGGASKPDPLKKSTGASFGELLDSLTQKGAASPAKTGALPPGAGIPFIMPPSASNVTASNAMSLADKLLTDLDMYQNALSNEAIPLSRLEPLVGELVARKDDLAAMIRDLPDEELRGILSDTLAVVMDMASRHHAGYAA